MDKSKIPPINLYSIFKPMGKEKVLEWMEEFSSVLKLEREWDEMSLYDITKELQPFYGVRHRFTH